MNNRQKLRGLKVVGYYSTITKKVYQAKSYMLEAEKKHKERMLVKVNNIKKEVQILRDYVKNILTKMKPCFMRLSEFLEIKRYLKLAKADTPKGYKHLINYSL